jgi:hypothetical protein
MYALEGSMETKEEAFVPSRLLRLNRKYVCPGDGMETKEEARVPSR